MNKKVTIVLSGILAFLVIIIVVPLLVALAINTSLVVTDTSNGWIGFWGNYLGALLGGILGVAGAGSVLERTQENNKKAQEREEVLSFCDYLVKQGSAFQQKSETVIYRLSDYCNDYKKYKAKEISKEDELRSFKELIEIMHEGKVVTYEIASSLLIHVVAEKYRTSMYETLRIKSREMCEDYICLERNVKHIREVGINSPEVNRFMDETNEIPNLLRKYEMELIESIMK
jgi:hypothetical protein